MRLSMLYLVMMEEVISMFINVIVWVFLVLTPDITPQINLYWHIHLFNVVVAIMLFQDYTIIPPYLSSMLIITLFQYRGNPMSISYYFRQVKRLYKTVKCLRTIHSVSNLFTAVIF